MSFNVAIEDFNGPLDLMSHLIKVNKLDLFNLDMSVLAEQYLAYIMTMQDKHLEVASEYLVELASLVEYKSKKLLPVEESILDDNYEEDQRDKLVKRIIEYEKIKKASNMLEELADERNLHFTKIQSIVPAEWQRDDTIPDDMNIYDLLKSIQKMYQRIALSKPLQSRITVKEVSVDECLIVLRHKLSIANEKRFTLIKLLNDCEDMQECVITFLALLDMAKHGEIHFVIQDIDNVEVIKGELKYD